MSKMLDNDAENKEDSLILSLKGKAINGYMVLPANLRRGRFVEETDFEIYLEDEKGFVSSEPAIKGKYFAGRGRFYTPWLEIRYKERSNLDSKVVDLSQNKVDERLFMLLFDILPPGGHMMVVYLDHEETARGLERGFPPMATPIGRSLWMSGFTWFKDWYFPEGFMGGDVKLQGSKPLNSKDRVRNLSEAREELLRFLSVDENGDDLTRRAWSRATGLLREIDKELS